MASRSLGADEGRSRGSADGDVAPAEFTVLVVVLHHKACERDEWL
jgi:hypothetical protein